MKDKTDAIAQLTSRLSGLSASEKTIASYILDNPVGVTNLSVRELADLSGTSPATVSRFARALGYESYSDFRFAMAMTVGDASPKDFGGNNIDLANISESLGFILHQKITELQETTAAIEPEAFKAAAETMKGSNHVLICAGGNTITVAMNAAFKFNQAGVRAFAPPTIESAMTTSINLTPDDTVLMLSSSGVSKRLGVITDNAEDSGATTIIVTNNVDTPLSKRADYAIRAVSRDAMFSKETRISQNSIYYVMELFTLFFLTGWDDTVERNAILQRGLGEDRQL